VYATCLIMNARVIIVYEVHTLCAREKSAPPLSCRKKVDPLSRANNRFAQITL